MPVFRPREQPWHGKMCDSAVITADMQRWAASRTNFRSPQIVTDTQSVSQQGWAANFFSPCAAGQGSKLLFLGSASRRAESDRFAKNESVRLHRRNFCCLRSFIGSCVQG